MNTSDARYLFGEDSDGPGWKPLTAQALASDLATTHPQLTVRRFHAQGGMGAIYEGTLRQGEEDLRVAIKVLRPDAADDADYLRRFRREQDILASLGAHPHIVRHRLHGTTADGYPFLVMDWVEGTPLTQLTQPDSSRDKKLLLQLADDLCAAVQHAHEHEHQILHRDLKPQNIIVTPQGRAVVLDFGIARSLRPGHTFTAPGGSPGTHGYIAPEILNGEKPDERADIYSLGIIIYQLLMKRLPSGLATRPSEESLDPRFDDLVKKATAAEPRSRYQTVSEFATAMRHLHNEFKTNMSTSDTSSPPDPKSITIEYDDDWITIRRALPNNQVIERVFSSEPFLSDLIEVLGEPDKILPNDYKTVTGEPMSKAFLWCSLGIFAGSQTPRSAFNPKGESSPNDRTRERRIYNLSISTVSGSIFGHVYESLKPFTGVVKVCGIECHEQLSLGRLANFKKGNPLTISQPDKSSRLVSAKAEKLGEIRLCLTAPSQDSRIETFSFGFEDWWQPSDPLAKLPLANGETIINSASAETYRGHSFSLMLTTRRLFVVTDSDSKAIEINLADEPHVVEVGWKTISRIYDYIGIEVAVVLLLVAVWSPIDCIFKLGTLITTAGKPYLEHPEAFMLFTTVLGIFGFLKVFARYELKEPHQNAEYLRGFRLSARDMNDLFLYRGGGGLDVNNQFLVRDRVFFARLQAAVTRYGQIDRKVPVKPVASGEVINETMSSHQQPEQSPMEAVSQSSHSSPRLFIRLSCGCRVHPFARRCQCGTPNTFPKQAKLALGLLGILGFLGLLFGGRDNAQLSLFAIGASVVGSIILAFLAQWWNYDRSVDS